MNRKNLKNVGAGPVSAHTSKARQNNGITLIALIITIIVMLILVAVTISMAINGGLFEKAGEAVGGTENAVNKEQELSNGKIEIGGVLYDSIDDYINGIPSSVHNWTRTGDTFKCSHCNTTYEMGQIVNYTPAGKTSTTISAAKSGISVEQTIERQNANWIVLGIEDTNKDGINETLLITTKGYVLPTTDKGLVLYGAAAYNNGPSEINRICEELYSNSEYGKARGMTIEDVNRTLNYTPKGGMYEDDSGLHELDGFNTTYKQYVTEIGKYTTAEEFDKAVEDGHLVAPEQGKNVGEYPINGYVYAASELSETTSTKAKEVVFGSSNNYNYWLASRGVGAYSACALFGPGYVRFGYERSFYGLFGSYGSEDDASAGLRPVVSLKSKLPELGTEDTSINPSPTPPGSVV